MVITSQGPLLKKRAEEVNYPGQFSMHISPENWSILDAFQQIAGTS
jgi:hypothetical protein